RLPPRAERDRLPGTGRPASTGSDRPRATGPATHAPRGRQVTRRRGTRRAAAGGVALAILRPGASDARPLEPVVLADVRAPAAGATMGLAGGVFAGRGSGHRPGPDRRGSREDAHQTHPPRSRRAGPPVEARGSGGGPRHRHLAAGACRLAGHDAHAAPPRPGAVVVSCRFGHPRATAARGGGARGAGSPRRSGVRRVRPGSWRDAGEPDLDAPAARCPRRRARAGHVHPIRAWNLGAGGLRGAPSSNLSAPGGDPWRLRRPARASGRGWTDHRAAALAAPADDSTLPRRSHVPIDLSLASAAQRLRVILASRVSRAHGAGGAATRSACPGGASPPHRTPLRSRPAYDAALERGSAGARSADLALPPRAARPCRPRARGGRRRADAVSRDRPPVELDPRERPAAGCSPGTYAVTPRRAGRSQSDGREATAANRSGGAAGLQGKQPRVDSPAMSDALPL